MEIGTDDNTLNIFNSVVSDIQSLQVRYEKALANLNAKLRGTLLINSNLQTQFMTLQEQVEKHFEEKSSLQSQINVMERANDCLSSTINIKNLEIDNLKSKCNELSSTIETLNARISSLEDDANQFAKVSHVVALEKENAMLRSHLEIYQRVAKKKENNEKDKVECLIKEPNECDNEISQTHEEEDAMGDACGVASGIVHDPEEIPQQVSSSTNEDDSEHLQVKEKAIKGTTYYVSCDDDMFIYEKIPENKIGKKLGQLVVSAAGRKKAIWFDESTH